MGPIEELLRKAWEIIKDPDKRCVKNNAVNISGNRVCANSEAACKWCSLGAIEKAANDSSKWYDNKFLITKSGTKYLYEALFELKGSEMISHYNDEDVINNPPKLYSLAIELAERDGV